jgi:hypothetical protein
MADPSRWLGGYDPRDVARTREEARKKLASIPKTEREGLSPSEYGKLKRAAEVGLENKFTMIEPLSGAKASKEQLKSIYSVTMRVEEFRRSLQAFDMDDVFVVASAYEPNDEGETWPVAGARPINLFSSSQDVDIETVKSASAFFTLFGQEHHVENLVWSGTKLLNSCDERLRQKVEEQTIGWPVEYATGPVYLKLMLDNILASSAESLRGLIQVLQSTTLKDFDGESVAEFVSFARGAVEQLRNHNALPIDALSLLANALKACETPDFVGYITTMYHNHIQGVKDCTVEHLLQSAEKEYFNLTTAQKWKVGLTSQDQESVFFAGNCFACGAKGHKATSRTCPKYKENQSAGHGGGRGRGFQRGGRGGRGRGRSGGRGGRGRGGSRIPKDKTPPKTGESKTRTQNNRVEKWCGRCGYWTWGDIAHVTEDCSSQRDAGGGTPHAANAASAAPASSAGDNAPSAQGTQPGSNTGGFAGFVHHAVDFS